jgi:hypothetical protein
VSQSNWTIFLATIFFACVSPVVAQHGNGKSGESAPQTTS